MKISVREYEETPALTVDWDLELAVVERQVQERLRNQ